MSPRKLYIDSRKRVSGTHSDFDYQLPNPIQVPKSRCFVDSVHLANVFPTITSHSRFIYIEEISTTNVSTKRKIGLTAGQNHDGTTLATEVALQLNTGTTLAANSYSCTFSSSTGKLTISNTTSISCRFQYLDGRLFEAWIVESVEPGEHSCIHRRRRLLRRHWLCESLQNHGEFHHPHHWRGPYKCHALSHIVFTFRLGVAGRRDRP